MKRRLDTGVLDVLLQCDECTECCKLDVLFLYPELGDDPNEYLTQQINGKHALERKANGECIYLCDTGCSIHSRRPAACREFDCRLFLDKKNERVLRVLSPFTYEVMSGAALGLVERMRVKRKSNKLRGKIPTRKSHKK